MPSTARLSSQMRWSLWTNRCAPTRRRHRRLHGHCAAAAVIVTGEQVGVVVVVRVARVWVGFGKAKLQQLLQAVERVAKRQLAVLVVSGEGQEVHVFHCHIACGWLWPRLEQRAARCCPTTGTQALLKAGRPSQSPP